VAKNYPKIDPKKHKENPQKNLGKNSGGIWRKIQKNPGNI
jgi:hypothetical protein